MVNFLIQISRKRHSLREDDTYRCLNHYEYQSHKYVDTTTRIDFLQHREDTEGRYYEDKQHVIFYLGYILFKHEQNDTLKQIKTIINDGDSVEDNIKSGKFIICVYDIQNRHLTIVNDRFGLIPYFVYTDKNSIIISTEPKGILNSQLSAKVRFQFDREAMINYLLYGHFLHNQYFVKEIRRQEPATKFTCLKTQHERKRYWEPKFEFNERVKKKKLMSLQALFRRGLRDIRKKYPGKYFSDISGGYDSRYIFIHAPSPIDSVMTLGDPDSNEYRHVLNILKLKKASLINVRTKLSNDSGRHIDKVCELMDSYFSPEHPETPKIIEAYEQSNLFGYNYDGFAGDILGGTYLNRKKEILQELGITTKYKSQDLKLKSDFRVDLITTDDNYEIGRKEHQIHNKRDLVRYKFYNRALNYILIGPTIRDKYQYNILPFFIYDFFDDYTQIRFEDLHLKKAYTKLYKLIPKKYLKLRDDFFKISFRNPYTIRLICSLVSSCLLKLGLIHEKKIKNYAKDITNPDCEMLRRKIIDKICNSRFDIVNHEMIKEVDKKRIKTDFSSILRIYGLVYFLDKYESKINKSSFPRTRHDI